MTRAGGPALEYRQRVEAAYAAHNARDARQQGTELSHVSAIRRIEMLLLPVMVADEHYSGEELDRFLASARKLLDS